MLLDCVGDGTTRVEVQLSAGGASGPDIYLVGGDRLVVAANGESHTLVEDRDWPNIVRYITALDVDDPGAQVAVSFERPNHVPAPDSHVVLPERITIQSPQSNQTFGRGDSITVSWDPSGTSDPMGIQFDVTCRDDGDVSSRFLTYSVADSGTKDYDVDDLLSEWSLGQNANCTAEIILVRSTRGSVSAEYRSGTIAAERRTSVSVGITP